MRVYADESETTKANPTFPRDYPAEKPPYKTFFFIN